MANKYRAQVPIDEVGKGCYLFFDMDALAKVEAQIGSENWWAESLYKLVTPSAASILLMLDHSLHLPDGSKAMDSKDFELPKDLPVILYAQKLLDALCLSVHGVTHGELEEKMRKESEEALKRNPQIGAEVLSRVLDERLSAPVSSPKSSGA